MIQPKILLSGIFLVIVVMLGFFVAYNYLTQTTEYQTTKTYSSYVSNIKYPMIAFVNPVFTTSAYHNAFYDYYMNNSLDPHIYLNTTLDTNWDDQRDTYIIKNIFDSGYPSNRTAVITDIDVSTNNLYYANGSLKYSVLIFFHSEYVTLSEYNNTYNYIAKGGNVFLLDGNAFYAVVSYNTTTNKVMLLHGHGYNFNGTTVTKTTTANFYLDTSYMNGTNWIGNSYSYYNFVSSINASLAIDKSNPNPIDIHLLANNVSSLANEGKYHSLFGYYFLGEADTLVVNNANVIASWNANSSSYKDNVKIYQIFPAGGSGGSLIHYGVYGNAIIPYDLDSVKLIDIAVKEMAGYYNNDWIRYPTNNAVFVANTTIQLSYTGNTTLVDLVLNNANLGQVKQNTVINSFLKNGTNNITLLFRYNSFTISRQVAITYLQP